MNKTSGSLILVFLVSILYALAVYYFQIELVAKPIYRALLLVGYMWIPGVVSLAFARFEGHQMRIFKKPGSVFFLAPLVGIAFLFLSYLISIPLGTPLKPNAFFGGERSLFEAAGLILGILGGIYIASLTLNMASALGEELYWRGYLFDKVKKWGLGKAMLVIGIIWGLRQVPLVILIGSSYQSHPILGSGMMLLLCMSMTPVLTYLRFRGEAIMVPAALHGSINASAGLSDLFFVQPNPLLIGMTGMSGFASILLISAAMGLFSRSVWKKFLV